MTLQIISDPCHILCWNNIGTYFLLRSSRDEDQEHVLLSSFNLTRWSRVLRDTAASQLNDALRARLRDWALVRVSICITQNILDTNFCQGILRTCLQKISKNLGERFSESAERHLATKQPCHEVHVTTWLG